MEHKGAQMKIAVIKETLPGEKRIAISPGIVKRLKQWDFDVLIEKDAGLQAGFADTDFETAGAAITSSAQEACQNADMIFKIWAPQPEEDRLFHANQTIIANFQALANKERLNDFAKLGLRCFALDLIPRISRAQSMDILSSQSNLAGYKAVIDAVAALDKAVPMMMTAGGTIPPAKVLVLGAGVAGLQAIATAKRLGAQVYASDVRPQVKEQVESLGGRFLEVKTTENFETNGGYAKETSADYQKKQNEAIAEQLKVTDIAITTALIPGRPAPRLISAEMLKMMPYGSVIIDMATATGGNVEGAQDNKIVEINGIKIIGNSNLAASIPNSASMLFARNIFNFIAPMYNSETKELVFNFHDELVEATCICQGGKLTGAVK